MRVSQSRLAQGIGDTINDLQNKMKGLQSHLLGLQALIDATAEAISSERAALAKLAALRDADFAKLKAGNCDYTPPYSAPPSPPGN